MPIYEYKCQDCGEIIEIFHKTFSPGLVTCKHCGSQKVDKLFSVPGSVIIKNNNPPGATCCGREERCDTPACSTGENCRRYR